MFTGELQVLHYTCKQFHKVLKYFLNLNIPQSQVNFEHPGLRLKISKSHQDSAYRTIYTQPRKFSGNCSCVSAALVPLNS